MEWFVTVENKEIDCNCYILVSIFSKKEPHNDLNFGEVGGATKDFIDLDTRVWGWEGRIRQVGTLFLKVI